jgi:hypothetical protein
VISGSRPPDGKLAVFLPGMSDFPAIQELARSRSVPIAGKDFKTGQTLMKTILALGLRARQLGTSCAACREWPPSRCPHRRLWRISKKSSSKSPPRPPEANEGSTYAGRAPRPPAAMKHVDRGG